MHGGSLEAYEAALDLVQSFQPCVVLLDIGLQGMDGYEVARKLRSREGEAKKICLVAVTGYDDEMARARSQAAGFDRHPTNCWPRTAVTIRIIKIVDAGCRFFRRYQADQDDSATAATPQA